MIKLTHRISIIWVDEFVELSFTQILTAQFSLLSSLDGVLLKIPTQQKENGSELIEFSINVFTELNKSSDKDIL